ncbi:MAG TPA: iron-containing alcohol dehydrogenase [Chloroflexota bacterium]
MDTFTFALPTRVVFGAGAVDDVGREAAALGRRALLVTGSTFARRSGLIKRLRAGLEDAGVFVSVYEGINPNSSVAAIDEGGEAAREFRADFVLGLGGGSALDGAKAIAVTAIAGRSIWDFTSKGGARPSAQIEAALPIVQVPLIASTGSETNDRVVVYDEPSRTRAMLRSPHLFARVAIVDPALTFTVPAHYTAVGAMNIVSQMLESYLTGDEFAASDRVTEGLIRVVMDSLARALRNGDDLDARNNLSWAATLASTVALAGRDGSTPLLSMAHPLTARYDLEHGYALAALWPSYMRYALANRTRLPKIGRFKRYALLGRQLFGVHETDDEVAAETTVYRFINWLRGMDVPTNLNGISMSEDDLSALAEQAVLVSGNGRRLPGGLSTEDVAHIYEGALRKV